MALVITVWILAALSLAGGAYWAVVRYRVERDGRNRPGLAEGESLTLPAWPSVSVIIPAHNEEEHAPDLLRTLDSQDYPGELEIIFVLDRCTDATRSALERERARSAASGLRLPTLTIIDNHSCPEDWAGKCNAARLGAAAGKGEILLFTDADTHFAPSLVRCAVALAKTRSLALLSALPEVSVRHAFEAAVQPVAAVQLMKLYPISRVNAEDEPRPFANGQFMLFTRESYDALGGHAAVKDDLLEDLAFARRMVHVLKRRAGLFVADGLLGVRMYESFAQFREGWRRILIEACHRNPSRMSRYAVENATVGAVIPLIALATLVAAACALQANDTPLAIGGFTAGAIALLLQLTTAARIYSLMGIPKRWAPTYPFGAIIVARILWKGSRDLRERRAVRWGGRQYILAPRAD